MNNDPGLRESDIDYICQLFKNTPEVEKAVIFGSRALNTYERGSDIDVAIFGDKINFNVVAHLHFVLEEESPMPYFFDIVDYTHLKHEELKKHIDKYGIEIFDRKLYPDINEKQ
jgi:predicted nucleotidyltransferase